MKVLFAAPYIYDPGHPEFMKNATGFGYMVKDILDGVSQNNKVFLLTHQFSSGYKNGYIVLKHCKLDIVKSINFKDAIKGIKRFFSIKACFGDRLRYVYYSIDKGYIKHSISRIKPDIVHIHGLTLQTEPFIEVCRELEIPFIVTLHGLNGLNNTTVANNIDREYEKKELTRLSRENRCVSVVSSGIKDRIINEYNIPGNNIKVVLNGTIFGDDRAPQKHDCFNILCIGNISRRKNQLQIVRAYNLLPREYKDKVFVTFCGGNSENINLVEEIENIKAKEHLKYVGYVKREKIIELWNSSDLNIVASEDEGFGLSMIEGFAYGIPTLTFADLDAVKDLYNSEAMITVNERKDIMLAKGLIAAFEREWDSEQIIQWAKNFSMNKIVQDYESLYCIVAKKESVKK